MTRLMDWPALWDPVPQDRPCQVWLPQPPARPTPSAVARGAARRPRSVVLALTPEQAQDLAGALPRLLADSDVGQGDRIDVDLGSAACVDVAGLELLLSVLWRRVGPQGDVAITGGTPGLRAQLRSLGVTAADCRQAVHGPPPPAQGVAGTAAVPVQEPLPAVPAQVDRQRHGAGSPPDRGRAGAGTGRAPTG